MTRFRLSVALGLASAVLCSAAPGAETITQTGTASFTAKYPMPFADVEVNFPIAMDGTPKVSVSYAGTNEILRNLTWKVSRVTSRGFSVGVETMPSQFVGTTIPLNWTATGPGQK